MDDFAFVQVLHRYQQLAKDFLHSIIGQTIRGHHLRQLHVLDVLLNLVAPSVLLPCFVNFDDILLVQTGENVRNLLGQVSGCRYTFDRNRPFEDRIVDSDIDPERTYSIVCEKQTVSRENIWLADLFEQIPHTDLEISIISAAWSYIEQCSGQVSGVLEERVKELN